MYHSSRRNIMQYNTVFDIDNNKKCFLGTKSAY